MSDPAGLAPRPEHHVETRRNQLHALVLLLVFGGAVLVVGLLVVLVAGLGVVGLAVVVLLAAAATLAAYAAAAGLVLRAVHARPADPVQYQRVHNLVEGLCIAEGLSKPSLYVIDDPAPNALSVGRGPRTAAVAVTTGLVDALNRVELEGVLAHELSHVKNDDIVAGTVAVTTLGALSFLGPLAASLMQFAVGSRREVRADADGVLVTRYPPGLCAALKKIQADPAVVRHRRRTMAQLWFASPLAHDDHASRLDQAFETHPPLRERIRFLEAM